MPGQGFSKGDALTTLWLREINSLCSVRPANTLIVGCSSHGQLTQEGVCAGAVNA